MPTLFGRVAQIQVGTLIVSDLRVSFKVKKSLRRNPNKAEIKIYNLSPTMRAQLEQSVNVPCKLEIGYKGSPLSTIFLGDLRTPRTERDNVNLVTTITNGDGERRSRSARVNQSFPPGTQVGAVLQHIVGALGIDPGNTAPLFANARLGSGMQLFAEGTTAYGNAHDELDRLVRSAGLEVSVQDGVLQAMPRGQALPSSAVVLNADSGLLGYPSISNEGVVKFKALLVPDIVPGRNVTIQTQLLNGTYRVETADYVGDTGGPDWYVQGEAKA
jgi:hypothetical protein